LDKLGGPYTLVLADPPYEDERAVGVLESLSGRGLVRQRETLLVLEHSARNEPKSEIGGLALVSSRRHGDSGISIYR